MNWDNYPVEWKELATLIKEANGWRCQQCGRICLMPGEEHDFDRRERARRTLTIAHALPDYHAAEVFVMALCAPCHLSYDRDLHRETRHRNVQNTRQCAGQLSFYYLHTLPRRTLRHE